ncbi:MAG: DNA primase [Candidatus Kapaibacterium sp.]
MRTSDDIVERVRNATSIVDVVSEHVRLRKRGRNHIGLCPFHTEKTPSFNVVEDKGIYKCFGCGEAGDVFSFVMKIEGLTFPEALAKLAKSAGIDYTPQQRTNEQASEDRTEPIINACREFAAFCYRALRSENGMGAMEYLRDREFSEEALKKFGVGYAPDGNASFLHSQEISNKTLQIYEQAGIISRSEGGEYYDRFRSRIIFPVMNPTGRIIAFGGRIMPGSNKELAKYVNSPETQIYHKSHVLYGLFQAKDAIRKKDYAIMVEGYADVLAVSQAGFENVIASAGTSLTIEQLNLLRRYTKTIVLLFDADLAGKNAILRGIELALSADFDVSCIVLPAGEDPDSYLRKEGAEGFERQLNNRTSFAETKARLLKEQGLFDTPEGASRAIHSIVETIAKIPDAIKRELYIRRIAEKFKLMESTLLSVLQKNLRGARRDDIRKAVEQIDREQEKYESELDVITNSLNVISGEAERKLLIHTLSNFATAYKALIDLDFDYTLIESEFVKSIIITCIRSYEENGESPTLAILLEAFRDDNKVRDLLLNASIIAEIDSIDDSINSDQWEIKRYGTQTELDERLYKAVSQTATKMIEMSLEKMLADYMRSDINKIADDDELKLILEKAQATAQMIHAKD